MRCQPRLPDSEPGGERRTRLVQAQRSYQYLPAAQNLLFPVGIAVRFPLWKELWTAGWMVRILWRYARVRLNQCLKLWLLRLAALNPKNDVTKLYRFLYSSVFWLRRPPQFQEMTDDERFARERLDGANPLVIERVRDAAQLQALIPVGDAELSQALEANTTVAAEIAGGRLLVCNYQLLQRALLPAEQPWAKGNLGRDSRWREKYLPAPVALFARAGEKLLPVAITIDQPGCQPNPLYLRSQKQQWRLAKLYVRVADANLQEQAVHNYQHHFVAGAIAASTRRQLDREHPLHVLFEPHIAHTLMVNKKIFGILTTPGSNDDQQFAGDLEEDRQILIACHQARSWRALRFEEDVARRGMENHPDYPWREDAQLWRQPLREFVRAYLGLYYHSDAAVAGDRELQAWLAELKAPEGGNLEELGTLATVDELVELAADVLFLCGPSHAAIHFPLQEYATWVEALPRAAYRPPPLDDDESDELTGRINSTLPPMVPAALQFAIGFLAGMRYRRFGQYGAYRLGKVREARPAIATLKQRLDEITRTIEERNRSRVRPYRYLLPALVPNSINL